MSQSFLLEELKKGASSWNEWRKMHPSVRVNLSGVYLTETNLRAYNLRDADLSNATLIGADLTRADLRGANLAHADVRFAEFSGALLTGAHFDGTQGIDEKTLQASLPGINQSRKRQFLAVAAVATALIGLAFWRNPSAPASALKALESDSDAAQRLDSYERLTHEIRKVEFPTWRIESVHVADDLVTLRINRQEVTDESYLLTLAAACGALIETPEAPVREIRVLNNVGAAGWIYGNPDNCAVLLRAPIATLRLAAAANSRPFTTESEEDF